MKISYKLVALLIFTLSFMNAQVRIAADLGGDHTFSAEGESITWDTEMGFSIGYENMFSENAGVGVEYQLERAVSEAGQEGGKFGFTSVYGVGKFDLGGLYAFARGGYALVYDGDTAYKGSDSDESVTLSGGLMYGFGAGYNVNDKMAVEGGYYVNNGEAKVSAFGESFTMDLEYSRIGVGLVYKLK